MKRKPFLLQKSGFLLLLGGMVIFDTFLAYLFVGGRGIWQQFIGENTTAPQGVVTPAQEIAQIRPQPPCKLKQRDFQMGVAYPQWQTTGYGENDASWLTALPAMRSQTAACWVEMPLLFSQPSLNSTTISPTTYSTPTIASFAYGVNYAHDLGLHVFVTLLLQVGGSQSWSGAIKYTTVAQEQQWFAHYWQAIQLYVVAASRTGVEQLAIGSEYQWLQEYAPDSLWNGLIANIHRVYAGTLTYDVNWTSVQLPVREWMRNPALKMIGISAYFPLIPTPERVAPHQIPGLWAKTARPLLDAFALALGEPVLISEIGYRNSADALYHSWESSSAAPADPAEQAAADDAALTVLIADRHILGCFFWGWDDTGSFNLKGLPAATAIHARYASLEG